MFTNETLIPSSFNDDKMLNIEENKRNYNGYKKCTEYIFFFFIRSHSYSVDYFYEHRYKSGMLHTGTTDEMKQNENEKEMSRLINETTASILKIFNAYGASAVEDWEVNELLEWTHNLNYDEYLFDWRTIGTSASSNVIYGWIVFIVDR